MVKALIDNKDRLLLPGMFSDVSILLNSADNVFVIPNSAIFSDDLGKNYIYVVKQADNNPPAEAAVANTNNAVQYRAYQREVNILFTSKDKVALSGGLEDGEEVVMFGREFLKNGSLVNRIENDPTILEYITPQATAVASANTNQNTSANQTAAVKKEDTSKPTTTAKQTTTASKPATTAKQTTTTSKPATTAKQTTTASKPTTTTSQTKTTTTTNTSKTTESSSSDNSIYSIGG